MRNEMELKIMALFYRKIKSVFEDDDMPNNYDRAHETEKLIKYCEDLLAINREIESNEPYVKVVEKLEEAGNE